MLKYDFLDNNFTTYESVNPVTTIKTPLFTKDIDWGYVNPNGVVIANNNLEQESKPEVSKLIVNNNDEINPQTEEYQNFERQSFTNTSKSVGERPKQAVEFFKSKFIKELHIDEETADRSAKAIVGNFMFESGDPTLAKTGNIGDKNLGPKGSAYGIGQWRLDRRAALKNFAAKRGKSISDFNTQLEFAWDEMNNSQKSFKILENLFNSKTLEEATKNFMNTFERPSNNLKINKLNERIKYAKSLG